MLDTTRHAPGLSVTDVETLQARFVRDMIVGDSDGEFLTSFYSWTTFYSWATSCWNCQSTAWVWMELGILGPTISADCERIDVRGEMSRRISGVTPIALVGTVTTKAGGTYRGFACPNCFSVLGKHFLRQELYRGLLADKVTTSYFPYQD